MTWRIRVPARMGTRSGWLVLNNGEPACTFSEGHILPTRDAARRVLPVLRRRHPAIHFRIVRCYLVLGWDKGGR